MSGLRELTISSTVYRPVVSSRERKSGRSIDIEATKRSLQSPDDTTSDSFSFDNLRARRIEVVLRKNKMLAESLFDMREDLVLKLGLVLVEMEDSLGKLRKCFVSTGLFLISAGRQRVQILRLTTFVALSRWASTKRLRSISDRPSFWDINEGVSPRVAEGSG